MIMSKLPRVLSIGLTAAMLGGCAAIDRLANVGRAAEAFGDRQSYRATGLQAGADADAGADTGLLQS